MTKETLLQYCGSLEQVASVRPVTYEDGRAGGMRAILLKNGLLEYSLMQDKCLDMASLSYRGINLAMLTKPGLQGRNPYDTSDKESSRSIMGGAMFTCGFENIQGARTVNGTYYPMHGRMRTTPMEKICMDARFEGDQYRLTVSGEGREACLFGHNTVLRRTVTSSYGETVIRFHDVIENQSFRPEPICFLYHVNIGYPFLREGCRILIPYKACQPQSDAAAQLMGTQFIMDPPEANAKVPQSVYLYEIAGDERGNTMCAVINPELEMALCIRWNVKQIPFLNQWKATAAGDYVLGLEPTNTGFAGREEKNVQILQPLEQHMNDWSMEIVEGKAAIAVLENEYRRLQSRNI